MSTHHPDSARSRRLLIPALLVAAISAAAPISAQTLLLSVWETTGGSELTGPRTASEGLESGLFDKGFIVFDLPAATPRPSAADLAASAQAVGAEAALLVEVDYHDAPRGTGISQVSGKARFTLVDAAGTLRARGVEEASNRDRVKPLTRLELGREIGARVAARVVAAFESRRKGS
jgi:hypothetical protein